MTIGAKELIHAIREEAKRKNSKELETQLKIIESQIMETTDAVEQIKDRSGLNYVIYESYDKIEEAVKKIRTLLSEEP